MIQMTTYRCWLGIPEKSDRLLLQAIAKILPIKLATHRREIGL
ncbi:hypothetical protein QT975_03940 [Microcoleus sp. w2-18aC4]